MSLKNCRSIAQIFPAAKESLLLPQYTERLTGLLYVYSGSGILTGYDESPVSIEAGTVAVYPAWRPYRLTACEDASVLLCTFLRDPPETVSVRLAETRLLPLDTLVRTMNWVRETLPEGNLLELAGLPSPEIPDIPQYVQSARRIIDAHYGEDLTLEDLATRVGRSKYHLSRAFRECYGITIGAYLASIRLARAEELLTETNLPVREIGRQVGFSNSAYFSSLFRQRFGCAPREHRTFRKKIGPR